MKILGKGNYSVEILFYAYGQWNCKELRHKTLKQAYIKMRIVQHNYNGAMYRVQIIDNTQATPKVRFTYWGETSTTRWLNRWNLREGNFQYIANYESLARG